MVAAHGTRLSSLGATERPWEETWQMNDVSPFASKPAHVPQAAVYDFDMYRDPALLADPHERVREILRKAPPVFWTPRNGGHWVAIGHEAVFEASRDTAHFSSERFHSDPSTPRQARKLPDGRHIPQPVPISMDPPEHGKFRAPLASVFGPRAIKARTEEIRTLAVSLIEAVKPHGRCDLIPDVAEPLPVQVFLKMMGLPLDRQADFRRMVHEFLAPAGRTDPLEMALRRRMVADACGDVILARKDEPKDDLISLLWAAQIEGEKMTVERLEDFSTLLFIAGLDTVINGMGFGVRHLARNPDFQNELRAKPELIPAAAEELLRRYAFAVPVRRIAKEVEIAGVQLKPGEWLMLYLPGANLDPDAFPKPEVFDMDREDQNHIAFGVGPHRCLGAHLARLELQVFYQELLARLPTFRLDAYKPVKFHAGNIIAIDSLPLRWD
jgi:cytochrome P450